ncbi:DNA mismatch repair protein MutS [candidate division KSB1 bacterium]|nr:DNA mismatch repair protein MutS [candidate division KSB1 bacterium]
MEQYLKIKNNHPDDLLLFRMGDFYEMFFEDAKTGAEVLGITLTSRAHGKAADVPLAGFPHHALDNYLTKLIKAGLRVAICEQVEDPKLAKTIVKRKVIEIVSPGTAITDDLLETKRNNYLASVFFDKEICGFAVVDVSTGEFQLTEVPVSLINEKILTFNPAEILVSESQITLLKDVLDSSSNVTITHRDDWTFNYDYSYQAITDHFSTLTLKGFGVDNFDAGISAAGAVLAYLKENQSEKLVHINRLFRSSDTENLIIDSTTRRNLELISSMTLTGKRGTLLSILDKTRTPMGGRMLVNWLLFPLKKLQEINRRLDAVEVMVNKTDVRSKIRDKLSSSGDLERLLAKFATGRANARDALAILISLKVVHEVKQLFISEKTAYLQQIFEYLNELNDVADRIQKAIIDNPPLSITDGGIIRRGYDEELDKLRDIAYSGKDWIARLQAQERENTGISSLKVNFNKVFGYYIEVTKANLSKVPSYYIRKQTLVNAERFITQELKEYEEKILGAEEKMASIEYRLFNELRLFILDYTVPLQNNARSLAQLDCITNLAQVAVDNEYGKPQMNETDRIIITDGRHPVVEKLLPPGEQFVCNDIKIDNKTEQILIITGPNMAGKSTYLRQIGLIVIMAQMGGFVPASKAQIGLVDRVFTRVGASDNLAAGESTFLTEMNETANILNNATPDSLVLLDEIGRGTSTFDGLSLAWSVVEYIHNTDRVAAKTVFATHFHELTELELVLPRVKNYNVAVKEWGDHIVFLRKIITGGCDHSYGIHVAQLAGLPGVVINRAKEVLQNLESESLNHSNEPKIARHHEEPKQKIKQLSLFAEMEKSLRKELQNINPDELTPLEALNKLDQLKQLLNK